MKNLFVYPLRIHIEDTDFSGVVYHSNYLKFLERARSEWLDHLKLGIEWQRKHRVYFVVHRAVLAFIKPAHLHETVEVVSKIKALRRVSICYDQYLRAKANPDKILFRAEIKIACVDYDLRPKPIPMLPFELSKSDLN